MTSAALSPVPAQREPGDASADAVRLALAPSPTAWADPAAARARGKASRRAVPRSEHAVLAASDRDPVAIVSAGNAGRLEHLVPLRIGRMSASPFAFLRGAAGVMAHDLAGSPRSGLVAQVCGDAHLSNVGFYASPERRLVLDVNDFDETVVGPWEYDLKRLVASVVVAGREAGAGEDACRSAAYDGARAYRQTARTLAKLPFVEAWAFDLGHLLAATDVDDLGATLERVRAKAVGNGSSKVATRFTQRVENDGWRFLEQPPVLTQVVGREERAIEEGLRGYLATLPEDRRTLLGRFTVADVAFRVVGVGSVGTRAYVALLHGNGEDDALVLQVKESRPSVYAGDPACEPGAEHAGRRVVLGQKAMQTASDPLLGWATVDGRPFLVRTFRDMKGSIDPVTLRGHQLDDYARLCGALLARAHARTLDPRALAAYLGKSDELDVALAAFAMAYADRTEADHAALVAAVRSGRLPAQTGV
ncbi:DUF2252 domain-containing protein [Motilibacter deserti]|uniref:DUF2252 domain-containing protein n=1 Tax=Motilibacter deserti TaxID=2714956 RepID=A0ABX0H278_9ACTN|nr:DUF2252 domain-containing protein [Motilibacter deserti]NHC15857.1 DUF2252 domain-containing protein [Motilibacter deserti]